MKSILMLISSSPNTPEARQALELAKSLWEGGNELGIFFIQDGVYHAVTPSGTQEILSEGKGPLYCLTEDLEMRGFGAKDVILPVKLSDYDQLVGLMMKEFGSTIGAF